MKKFCTIAAMTLGVFVFANISTALALHVGDVAGEQGKRRALQATPYKAPPANNDLFNRLFLNRAIISDSGAGNGEELGHNSRGRDIDPGFSICFPEEEIAGLCSGLPN